jgi:IstB-like ATP binding protein
MLKQAVLDAFTTSRPPCDAAHGQPRLGCAATTTRARSSSISRTKRRSRGSRGEQARHLPAAARPPRLPQARRPRRATPRRPRARREDHARLHTAPARPARRRGRCDPRASPGQPAAARRVPFHQDTEAFDVTAQPSLDRRLVDELATLRFIEQKANVLAIGPPGVGKTMLAIALGLKAVHAGYRVYYTTANADGARPRTRSSAPQHERQAGRQREPEHPDADAGGDRRRVAQRAPRHPGRLHDRGQPAQPERARGRPGQRAR